MSGFDVAVLGAGGTIAPALVRDLAESDEVDGLLLLDRDGSRAAGVAAEHGSGKARAVAVDLRRDLAAALGGCRVLVNASSYRLNLVVMEGALAAGCDYVDLGGMYWMTALQLELDERFRAAGRLAVIGMGASPGKTSVMAVRGARELGGEPVREIHLAGAERDPEPADGLRAPWALQTLLDEITLAPIVLEGGAPHALAPSAPGGIVRFPEPIGEAATIHTLHSSLRTLGSSFGARRASFRLSLAPELLKRLEALRGAAQREVSQAAATNLPPSPHAISAHVVEVRSAQRSIRISALSRPVPEWGLGGGVVSAAAPAAAVVRLIARGRIGPPGVHAPETCVDPDDLFPELERRGCAIEVAP